LTAKIFAVKMTLWAERGELNVKAHCIMPKMGKKGKNSVLDDYEKLESEIIRDKVKKDSVYSKNVNFTPFGWIYLLILLFTLLGGYSIQYLAPDSHFGKLTSVRYGRFIWTVIIILFFYAIQKVLSAFGISIEKHQGKD